MLQQVGSLFFVRVAPAIPNRLIQSLFMFETAAIVIAQSLDW